MVGDLSSSLSSSPPNGHDTHCLPSFGSLPPMSSSYHDHRSWDFDFPQNSTEPFPVDFKFTIATKKPVSSKHSVSSSSPSPSLQADAHFLLPPSLPSFSSLLVASDSPLRLLTQNSAPNSSISEVQQDCQRRQSSSSQLSMESEINSTSPRTKIFSRFMKSYDREGSTMTSSR